MAAADAAVHAVSDPIVQMLTVPLLNAVVDVEGAVNRAADTVVSGTVTLVVDALLPAITQPIEDIADVVVSGLDTCVAAPCLLPCVSCAGCALAAAVSKKLQGCGYSFIYGPTKKYQS